MGQSRPPNFRRGGSLKKNPVGLLFYCFSSAKKNVSSFSFRLNGRLNTAGEGCLSLEALTPCKVKVFNKQRKQGEEPFAD